MDTLAILFVALLLDRFVGDPDWLWTRVPHPVVIFGKLIDWADARFNAPSLLEVTREKRGFAVIAVLLIASVVAGSGFAALFDAMGWAGWLVEIVIVAVLLAQKSLAEHVAAVATGLRTDGLDGGRSAVSMIVGRNPETLDEAGVCRASIESLAENASDGVVAPAFWYAVFGLPGLFAYKMLNTADSMIGHQSERHRAFGRASAKLDDLANWVPARLTGGLIVVAAGFLSGLAQCRSAFAAMLSDARLHRSPNAGWPESAMAGALDLALGGPRIYEGDVADEPFMNAEGRKALGEADIDAALKVFWMAMTIGTVAVGLLVLLYT